MLTLYHDVTSAAALVAMLRLQTLADDGVPVAFRGFDVLGIDCQIPATLNDLDDWQRHRSRAAAQGWELARPQRHPPTLQAHLIGRLAAGHDLDTAWRMRMYRAHWLEGADVGDPDVLTELASDIGLDRDEVWGRLHDRGARQQLRQEMVRIRADGVGGVPVLAAGGTLCSPAMPDDDLRALAGV